MCAFRATTLTALALGLLVAAPFSAPALARTSHPPGRGARLVEAPSGRTTRAATARLHERQARARSADSAANDAVALEPQWADRPDESTRPSENDPGDALGATGIADRMAAWISATGDNDGMPFAIVDKLAAKVFVYGVDGAAQGWAPVLLGLARGDDSAPGIGGLKLSQIGADARTTPAGRFVAQYGPSKGHGDVLWVDFADSISMHPVMSVSPGEHRLRRIQSADPTEHRISYGCINVPAKFYEDVVQAAFANGGVVYILPDTKPLEQVFPGFAAVIGGGDLVDRSAEQEARWAAMAAPPSRLPGSSAEAPPPGDDP